MHFGILRLNNVPVTSPEFPDVSRLKYTVFNYYHPVLETGSIGGFCLLAANLFFSNLKRSVMICRLPTVRFGGSVQKLRSEDTLGLKSGSRTGVSDVLGEWLGSCGTRLRGEDNRPKAVAPRLMGNQDYSVQASQEEQEKLRTSHSCLLHAEISCR